MSDQEEQLASGTFFFLAITISGIFTMLNLGLSCITIIITLAIWMAFMTLISNIQGE